MNKDKLRCKIVMRNGRINSPKLRLRLGNQLPPSLDSACPQAKTELSKHDHMFME